MEERCIYMLSKGLTYHGGGTSYYSDADWQNGKKYSTRGRAKGVMTRICKYQKQIGNPEPNIEILKFKCVLVEDDK